MRPSIIEQPTSYDLKFFKLNRTNRKRPLFFFIPKKNNIYISNDFSFKLFDFKEIFKRTIIKPTIISDSSYLTGVPKNSKKRDVNCFGDLINFDIFSIKNIKKIIAEFGDDFNKELGIVNINSKNYLLEVTNTQFLIDTLFNNGMLEIKKVKGRLEKKND